LFDIEHFHQSLSTACPQLNIRRWNETSGIDITINATFRGYLDPSHSSKTFRALIDNTLSESDLITRSGISAQKQVRVAYGDPYLSWNYTAAGEAEVKKDLFKALQYNTTLFDLGTQVFDKLKQKSSGSVVAIHLRGEPDWPKGFGELAVQINLYTEALVTLRNDTLGATNDTVIKDVYVSCGHAASIEEFKAKLEPLGFVVHDKMSLLKGDADILERIENLEFDQRAITEYQSLVSADYFMGILSSSLSDMVSYARTIDEDDDYYEKYIHPGATRAGFVDRVFPDSPSVRGNNHTKLIVLTGPDIMDCFP
jgi:hypothetical protein